MVPRAPTAASIDPGLLGGTNSTNKLHERSTGRKPDCLGVAGRARVAFPTTLGGNAD